MCQSEDQSRRTFQNKKKKKKKKHEWHGRRGGVALGAEQHRPAAEQAHAAGGRG
jgi:hypothetical protein